MVIPSHHIKLIKADDSNFTIYYVVCLSTVSSNDRNYLTVKFDLSTIGITIFQIINGSASFNNMN